MAQNPVGWFEIYVQDMNREKPHETLDPQDWGEMRALAHRMVDDAISYIETVRERPVWQPVPDEVAARFDRPAPDKPVGAETTYREFVENILPSIPGPSKI